MLNKEDLFKVLNSGKRLNHYEPTKPKKRTLKTVLMSYTGNAIKKVTEWVSTELKEDLELIFKPVTRFKKKQMKGVDTTTLSKPTEPIRSLPKASQSVPKVFEKSDDISYDYFGIPYKKDVDIEEKEKPKRKGVTLLKENGEVVGLDNYEDVL